MCACVCVLLLLLLKLCVCFLHGKKKGGTGGSVARARVAVNKKG